MIKQAIKLSFNFTSLDVNEKRKRIKQVKGMIKKAQKKRDNALDVLWEEEQLRQQLLYMLTMSKNVKEGIAQIQALVVEYESTIFKRHYQSAFLLSEAAIVLFQSGDLTGGKELALSALKHAGNGGPVSGSFIKAMDLLRQQSHNEAKA